MNKLIRYCLYGIAGAICVVALFVGVYNQFFKKVSDTNETNLIGNANITTPEEANSSFKDLYTNQFFGTNYDDSKITKIDATKKLVYTYSATPTQTTSQATTNNNQANTLTNNASNNASQVANTTTQTTTSSATVELAAEGKYSILAYIPIININNDVVNKYNTMTQTIFVNKINDIITNSKVYTVCNITYTSYINNDILSLAIMATLKEGENAQRVIVQAYNYNLATGKDVTIADI